MTTSKSVRKSLKLGGRASASRSSTAGQFVVPSVSETSAFYYYANNTKAREEASARFRRAIRVAEENRRKLRSAS